jgi:hypothetical protein
MAKRNPYPLSDEQRRLVEPLGGKTIHAWPIEEDFVPGKRIQGLALGPLSGGRLWRDPGSFYWGLVAKDGTIQYLRRLRYHDDTTLAKQVAPIPLGAVVRIECLDHDYRVEWRKPKQSRK